MTIKQTFSAILSVAFMTATGLVIGTHITPKEANAKLKNDLLVLKKALNLAESKKGLELVVQSVAIVDRDEKKMAQLDLDLKKYSEFVGQFNECVNKIEKELAQLKFHKFMNKIHRNDYR